MVSLFRRCWILCFILTVWPGPASAQVMRLPSFGASSPMAVWDLTRFFRDHSEVIVFPPVRTPPNSDTVGFDWDPKRETWWASDQENRKILKRGRDGGWNDALSWGARQGNPGPIAVTGEHIWVVVESAETLYRFEAENPSFDRADTIPIPPAAIREVPSITGLTWDSEDLWLATGCGYCSTIFRIDPENGDVRESFFPNCEPRGLAYSQKDDTLWVVAYNGPLSGSLLSRRKVSENPVTLVSTRTYFGFGPGTRVPSDPTAVSIIGGRIWVVDRQTNVAINYVPVPLSP